MSFLRSLGAVLAVAVFSACQAPPRSVSDMSREQAARELYQQAYAWYRTGQLEKALVALEPLIDTPYLNKEARLLQDAIRDEMARPERDRAKLLSQRRAMDEVGERLILPTTYGRSRAITPFEQDIHLPPGPMEEMANKRVNVTLGSADIAGMVRELAKQADLNLIADESLQDAEQQPISISVKDTPVREILAYLSRNMGLAFHFGENAIWVTAAPEDDAGPQGPELVTRVYRLRYGYTPPTPEGGGAGGGDDRTKSTKGSAAADSVDTLLTVLTDFLAEDSPPGAQLKMYRRHNTLVIKDTPDNIRKAEQFIVAFDQIPQQVLIEARMLTVGEDDLELIGNSIENLTWTNTGKAVVNATSTLPAFVADATGAGALTVTGIMDDFTYKTVLSALQKQSSTRTLTSPRITVTNDTDAEIFRGNKRSYVRSFESEAVTRNNTNNVTTTATVDEGDIEDLETGTRLTVRPSIGYDGRNVTLGMRVDLTSFDNYEIFQIGPDNQLRLPVTQENTFFTTVSVTSGSTVVLGGTIESRSSDLESKVPLLGDLPLLGWLFKKKDSTDTPLHLLVFVKATIVDPNGVYRVAPEAEAAMMGRDEPANTP